MRRARRDGRGDPTWTELDEMNGARWYPTLITLANDRVQIIGGSAPFFTNAWHRVNEDVEAVRPDDTLARRPSDLPRTDEFRPRNDPRQLPSSHEGRVATLYNLRIVRTNALFR